MIDDLKRLISKRRGIKASVTKLITKVEDMVAADLDTVSSQTVSTSRKLLGETTLTQLKAKKDQIVELDNAIGEKIEAEEEYEEEITNADTYQDILDEKIAFLAEFIRKAGLSPQGVPPVTPHTSQPEQASLATPRDQNIAAANVHVSTNVPHTSDSVRVPQAVTRLPKQSLPIFAGDPLQWQGFWDSFNAAVNANPGLTGVQKFTYLRAQVQGDAARVIAGFPLTDDNYAHSIDLLQARYGQSDSHKLVNAHVEALLNLEKPSNCLSSLQKFYDTLEQHTRSLGSLRKSSEMYGSLLIPSVLSKLPTETRKHMAQDHHNSKWSIDDVMGGLLKEI